MAERLRLRGFYSTSILKRGIESALCLVFDTLNPRQPFTRLVTHRRLARYVINDISTSHHGREVIATINAREEARGLMLIECSRLISSRVKLSVKV